MNSKEIRAMVWLVREVTCRASVDVGAIEAVEAALGVIGETFDSPWDDADPELVSEARVIVSRAKQWLVTARTDLERAVESIFPEEPAGAGRQADGP